MRDRYIIDLIYTMKGSRGGVVEGELKAHLPEYEMGGGVMVKKSFIMVFIIIIQYCKCLFMG